MKRYQFFVFAVLAATVFVFGSERVNEKKVILDMMKTQVAEWNHGNFEGFMDPYWKSPELTFQSGNKRRYGWQNLLSMYKTNYAGEKRGVLNFTDIEIKFLGDELAYVLGRWQVKTLKGTETQKKEGLFTLILRKSSHGWVIIHDHSS